MNVTGKIPPSDGTETEFLNPTLQRYHWATSITIITHPTERPFSFRQTHLHFSNLSRRARHHSYVLNYGLITRWYYRLITHLAPMVHKLPFQWKHRTTPDDDAGSDFENIASMAQSTMRSMTKRKRARAQSTVESEPARNKHRSSGLGLGNSTLFIYSDSNFSYISNTQFLSHNSACPVARVHQ